MRCCATCRFWVPTEMSVYRVDGQPYRARKDKTETEMLRATHALCSWSVNSARGPDFMRWSPPWIEQRIGGGTLTKEDEGTECRVWDEREPVKLTADR